MISKKLGKGTDFDLSVYNAQTGEGKFKNNKYIQLAIIEVYIYIYIYIF